MHSEFQCSHLKRNTNWFRVTKHPSSRLSFSIQVHLFGLKHAEWHLFPFLATIFLVDLVAVAVVVVEAALFAFFVQAGYLWAWKECISWVHLRVAASPFRRLSGHFFMQNSGLDAFLVGGQQQQLRRSIINNSALLNTSGPTIIDSDHTSKISLRGWLAMFVVMLESSLGWCVHIHNWLFLFF